MPIRSALIYINSNINVTRHPRTTERKPKQQQSNTQKNMKKNIHKTCVDGYSFSFLCSMIINVFWCYPHFFVTFIPSEKFMNKLVFLRPRLSSCNQHILVSRTRGTIYWSISITANMCSVSSYTLVDRSNISEFAHKSQLKWNNFIRPKTSSNLGKNILFILKNKYA